MQKGKSTLNFISNWKEKHCEERGNNSNKNIKAYWKLFLRQAKLTLRLAILFFATIEKFRSDNGMLYGLVSIDAESTGKYIFHIFSCTFLRVNFEFSTCDIVSQVSQVYNLVFWFKKKLTYHANHSVIESLTSKCKEVVYDIICNLRIWNYEEYYRQWYYIFHLASDIILASIDYCIC